MVSSPAQVTIDQGKLRGFERDGVRVFRGVPFAKPPVGRLRFRAPLPAEGWSGIREATDFAPAPIQQTTIMLNGQARPTLQGNTTSEDCLYLNIWAPAAEGPHPVFFWVYGGGNEIGATSDAQYDLEALARLGIVCVSAGYRFGALGFLDLSSIFADFSGSGNNGILDIILALEWIRHNIGDFGGDPGRVTIAGSSAGAMNINAVFAVRTADMLYHQAVILSGGQRVHSPEQAADVTRYFLSAADLKRGEEGRLLEMSSDALLQAQLRMTAEYPHMMPFRSVIDSFIINRSPIEVIRAGELANIRMLLNTNRDEAALRRNKTASDPVDSHELAYLSVPAFERQLGRYRLNLTGETDMDLPMRCVTAERYWIPTLRTAEAQASAGGCVFLSRFDFASESGSLAGKAIHGSDLPYWLDRLGVPTILQPAPDKYAPLMVTHMHNALSSFIKAGVPELAGGTDWPAFRLDRRHVMIIDRDPRIEDDPRGEERQLWLDWDEPRIVP